MRTRVGVAVTAIVAAAGLYAFSPRSMPQFEQTRIPVDKMQLNSIAHTSAGLVAAGELEGWQRWSADQVREDLVAKAEALLHRPDGQALGGRKMQESLRQLREQWKQSDQGGAANHGLWKKFDEACNAAHKVVEAWLEKIRTEAAEHKAQRMALIEEVKAWAQEHAASGDWKAINRALYQFGDRWREGGHVGEKIFAELQPLWKQAITLAAAPLEAAQKESLARRHAMIEEATALGAAPSLRIDAVKALQQRWQAEAQTVPLDRKHEQKLWDAFRKPIDEAFNRKSADRERAVTELSARDRVVLDASKALEAANATGDAQQIRAAMQALEAKQQRLLAEAKAKKSVKPQKEAEEQPEQIETPSGRDLASNALAMARLEGEIAKNIDEYSKRPRLKPISLRTLEYAGAVYLSGWDSKVERVGTLNYPAQARGKLYGAVSVWVVLDSAGAVVRIDVTKPSGQKILDDAARRIIQMGSPYGTIPAKVLDGADHLGFPRTLNFVSGNALKAK